ncbi:hypothetical protein [Pectobacterium phage Lelidair]|uniref:Uncharacterized protein n=3 Tax=Phimunavirus TaxID=2560202 RepID=A0A385IFZ5_9CAUD|nr:hypothetical protein HOU11_gp33 [Pectobacterium phage Gaspode]YP_009811951.1 hypothetical protein HOU13_gp31 [Pectobacterium phage Lelidair]AXY81690.1 hypothetical protein [Pectobacterium phage Gaspode]AXY81800.1 hypothetical protein [Pectobacterium phage Lelidair]AZF94477.1 hypothetical protein [Pectobacterium phage Ekidair]
MLVSKTDFLVSCGDTYETLLDRDPEDKFLAYTLEQVVGIGGAVRNDAETVYLNRDQAIEIAKTILRNEGINVG